MQTRLLDFYALRTTDNLNTRMEQLFPKCLISGMAASKGSSNYDVTLGLGVWFCDGVAIKESAPQADIVTLDDPSASDRLDVVYGTFAYEADTEQTPASYGVLKGTPSAVPTAPSVGANKVKLVEIYVPSTASDLDDCQIGQSYAQQDQLEMLLSLKIEGNFWAQEELEGSAFDTTLPSAIKAREQQLGTGDLWLNLTDDRFYRGKWTTGAFSWECVSGKKHQATHQEGGDDALPWGDGNGLDADMVDGQHADEFAASSHTHPVSEIESPSDFYWLGKSGSTPATAASTGLIFHDRIPPISMSGTKLEITALCIILAAEPTEALLYTYSVDGASIGTATVKATARAGYFAFDTPIEVCPAALLEITAPANTKSAVGAAAYFVIRRAPGAASCPQTWSDLPDIAYEGGGASLVYAIDVSWTDGDTDQTGDGFKIYRSVDGGAFTLLIAVPIATVSYRDEDIDYGTDYQYRITEYYGDEESNYDETGTISVPAS